MSDMPRNDTERPDPKVARAVASWLRDEPDRVPDDLKSTLRSPARATSSQRASWTARWHQRERVRAPQPLVAGAALTAALAVIAVVLRGLALAGGTGSGDDLAVRVASPDSSASVAFDGRIDATIQLDAKATALGSGFRQPVGGRRHGSPAAHQPGRWIG